MLPNSHPQDDLLIVEALIQYATHHQEVEPQRADRAEQLAVEITNMHGLCIEDAMRQIDFEQYDPRPHPH